MELPDVVVQIIHAYAKPVTHPKWRTLRIMPNITFQGEYYLICLKRRDKLNNSNNEEYIQLQQFYKPQFSAWHYNRLFNVYTI